MFGFGRRGGNGGGGGGKDGGGGGKKPRNEEDDLLKVCFSVYVFMCVGRGWTGGRRASVLSNATRSDDCY